MSTPPAPPAPRDHAEGGNVLTQRLGPFATWVWLLGLTVLILLWSMYSKRKQPANAQATAGQAVGAQQVPDIIIQNQEPPEEEPPPGVVPPSQPGSPPPKPPPTGGGGKPKPPPPPRGGPPHKPPTKYKTIKVARWTEDNTPWNSTLWGIAAHEHVAGGWQALMKLNGIKDPRKIQPGQTIRVPVS